MRTHHMLFLLLACTLVFSCASRSPYTGYSFVDEPVTMLPARRVTPDVESVCRILYDVYKTCYAAGLKQGAQSDDCLSTGALLYSELYDEIGDYDEIAEKLGVICTMACTSARKGEGLPSYRAFRETLLEAVNYSYR